VTDGKAIEPKRRIAWGRYLLLFFVAAWMFVLGVLVGRGTAPVHFDTQALQKELVTLRDAMLKKEREAVEKAIRGEDEKAPLEFYEALKKDGPDSTALIPLPQVAAGATPHPEATVALQTPPHKPRGAIMAKTAAGAVKPSAVAAAAPVQKPVATQGHLTIQVASLKDAAGAERLMADLKKDGYPAYLSRIVIPDKGIWFRVRVGSYTDAEQAVADMGRLTREQKNPILVKK
jgi:DedD protein